MSVNTILTVLSVIALVVCLAGLLWAEYLARPRRAKGPWWRL